MALPFEQRAAIGERGGRGVEALDVGRKALAFGLTGGATLPNLTQRLLQPRSLAVVRGERSPERLHLGTVRGRLLGDAPALVLGVAPSGGGRRERHLGLLELASTALELLRRLREPRLESLQILLERGQPNTEVRLRGEHLTGLGIEVDRSAQLELGGRLGRLGLGERTLRLLERPHGTRAFIGGTRDTLV